MKTQRLMKATAVNVMNFITHSMMEHAFLLAYETELADLKGLIPPGSISCMNNEGIGNWNLEFQLLEMVEDSAVKSLLSAMRKMERHVNTFMVFTGITREEVVFDERIVESATHLWNDIVCQMKYDNHQDIMTALPWMFDNYYLLLYNLAQRITTGNTALIEHDDPGFAMWDFRTEKEDFADLDFSAKYLLDIVKDIWEEDLELQNLSGEHYGQL
ncbi:hypothetical protein ACVWYN_000038 [Pedobacter sp. UYP24]